MIDSVHDFVYDCLMKEFTPSAVDKEKVKPLLVEKGLNYAIRNGLAPDEDKLSKIVDDTIDDFIKNNGHHGKTNNAFGKAHDANNSVQRLAGILSGLRW